MTKGNGILAYPIFASANYLLAIMANREQKFKSNATSSKGPFESDFLNRITQTHISVPIAMFVLYAAGLIWYTTQVTELTAGQIAGLFFAGIFFFTFVEYAMHRWLYHPPHGASEKYQEFTYTIHGYHHDYPRDKRRLAMPPWMAIIIATVFLLIFKLFLSQMAFSFTAGFVVGYAGYLMVHYSVHAFSPPKNFLKMLWVNHSIHHYSENEILFGVSQPFWDYVFRTIPKTQADKKLAKEIVV